MSPSTLVPALSLPTLGLAAALVAVPGVDAHADIIEAGFGFNTTAIDVFNTGASSNNNIPIDGVANVFTLTFTEGSDTGTATFEVSENFGNLTALRQLGAGLQATTGDPADRLVVELISTSNLASLSLEGIELGGNGVPFFEATLPDGTTLAGDGNFATSSALAADASSTFNIGDTLTLGRFADTGGNTSGLNLETLTLNGTPVPEPGSLLLGSAGAGLLALRRRRK